MAAAHVSPRRLARGPGGRACCRWCGTEVAGRRRSFCSDACVTEWRVRSDPAFARAAVFDRDRGVCALCGIDTVWLERVWSVLRVRAYGVRRDQTAEPDQPAAVLAVLAAQLGRFYGKPPASFYPYLSWGHLWEMDHTVPVVEGGGTCGLDGLRTLCLPCHRGETAKLAARRARRRTSQVPADQGVTGL